MATCEICCTRKLRLLLISAMLQNSWVVSGYRVNSLNGSTIPLRTNSSRSVIGLQPRAVFAAVQSNWAKSLRLFQSR